MKVKTSANFEREAKHLIKKYRSLAEEVADLISSLSQNPVIGTPIGQNCYKIRVAIKSKGVGKSGGGRVITCVAVLQETVTLLSIYDKSERANISDKELERLLKENLLD